MISWSEHVDVVCSVDDVWQAVADQHRVMTWSAWPKATGYACSVDGDGTSVGSGIVSTDGGVVRNRLANRGPAGRTVEPEVDFRFDQLAPGTCRVWLDFRLQPPVPTLLPPLVGAVLRRGIRPLHCEDLANLERDVEAHAG